MFNTKLISIDAVGAGEIFLWMLTKFQIIRRFMQNYNTISQRFTNHFRSIKTKHFMLRKWLVKRCEESKCFSEIWK